MEMRQCVPVLKEEAVECLFKPFSDEDLLDALNAAIQAN
jgi:FixJ family two-component response regulator